MSNRKLSKTQRLHIPVENNQKQQESSHDCAHAKSMGAFEAQLIMLEKQFFSLQGEVTKLLEYHNNQETRLSMGKQTFAAMDRTIADLGITLSAFTSLQDTKCTSHLSSIGDRLETISVELATLKTQLADLPPTISVLARTEAETVVAQQKNIVVENIKSVSYVCSGVSIFVTLLWKLDDIVRAISEFVQNLNK